MPREPRKKTPNPYPYFIPPVSIPPEDQLKKLSPQALWEFLRIEALLRSRKIMRWYKKGKIKCGEFLENEWKLPWSYFGKRHHHCYLDPANFCNSQQTTHGISDLRQSLILALKNDNLPTFIRGLISDPNITLLRIDCTFHPTMNRKALMDLLEIQYKGIRDRLTQNENLNKQIIPLSNEFESLTEKLFHLTKPQNWNNNKSQVNRLIAERKRVGERLGRLYPRQHVLKRQLGNARFAEVARRGKGNFLSTYMTYFRCYDRHEAQGMSFGEIGKTVLGVKPKSTGKELAQNRDLAKKQLSKLKHLFLVPRPISGHHHKRS